MLSFLAAIVALMTSVVPEIDPERPFIEAPYDAPLESMAVPYTRAFHVLPYGGAIQWLPESGIDNVLLRDYFTVRVRYVLGDYDRSLFRLATMTRSDMQAIVAKLCNPPGSAWSGLSIEASPVLYSHRGPVEDTTELTFFYDRRV